MLTVTGPPAITLHPLNTTTAPGQVMLQAAADMNPPGNVQWKVKVKGTANSVDIPSATFPQLLLNVTAADSGNQYEAVFTNGLGSATTRPATLTVDIPPAITTQPLAQSVDAGKPVTFTAAASGTPAPKVRWESSSDGGNTFTPVPGATTAKVTFTAQGKHSGQLFRAVFTNPVGTATTDAVLLTVTNFAPQITHQPGSVSVVAGSTQLY